MHIIVTSNEETESIRAAAALYSVFDLRPPVTRQWDNSIFQLIQGQDLNTAARCLALQNFNLFFGAPWTSHDGLKVMQSVFSDTIVLDATDVCENLGESGPVTHVKSCYSIADTKNNCCATHTFVDIVSRLHKRLAYQNVCLPCRCRRVCVHDVIGSWLTSYLNDCDLQHAMFLQCCKGPEALDIFIEHGVNSATTERKEKNVAWMVEPDGVIPVINVTKSNFALVAHRNAHKLGLTKETRNIPFMASWVSMAEAFDIPPQSDRRPIASIIASEKQWMPGHCLRHNIIESMLESGLIFPCGRKYAYLSRKIDGHRNFLYSIVVENCAEPGYISEKLIDCLMCRSVAFYYGAPDVLTYFDGGSVLPFTTIDELAVLLRSMSEDDYQTRCSSIQMNFHRACAYPCYDCNLALFTPLLSLPDATLSSCKVQDI